MATRVKAKSTAPPPPAAHDKPLVQALTKALSEVLDAVQDHAACFPSHIERTKISMTLDTGERLDIEVTGYSAESPPSVGQPPDPGHIHELEISGFAGFKTIDDLDLGASAKIAAEGLLQQFPADVKFTSGRRSISEQAAAMAPNVVQNRRYVEQTYKDTPQRTALQKWVDDHPTATSASAIAAGLEGIMTSWTEAQQRNFSRHITGDAFDVQPVSGPQGEKIKEAIAKLPKLNWHTFKEAGLEIWHAQFDV